MADIRCPKCGRNNPDLLDVCQFCQTPLKTDSVLHSGDAPTKKNTGELEAILPDWLKDVRQQSRASAEDDASKTVKNPTVRKNEPPDFLAGLASQAGNADDEEIPDWLASMNPSAKPESPAAKPPQDKPASPFVSSPESDFFAQFEQGISEPASEPSQEEVSSPEGKIPDQPQHSQEKDELSEWFTQTAEKPEEFIELDPETQQTERGWAPSFDSPLPSQPESFDSPNFRPDAFREDKSAPKEKEDLSWLHNLEETAKQTGDPDTPKPKWGAGIESASPQQSPGSGEDLSWLDKLSGIEGFTEQPAGQPAAPQDDLNWLNQVGGGQESPPLDTPSEKPSSQETPSWLSDLGAEPEPSQSSDSPPDKPITSKPFASEDLSWLDALDKPSQPSQPFNVPEKPSSQEDLSWLLNLGGAAASAQDTPAPSRDDLSWLSGLGGNSEPLSTPPFAKTGPLADENLQAASSGGEPAGETVPDWLKSATEVPSMPAPGDVSLDWFNQPGQPVEEKPVPAARTPQPPPFSDLFSASGESQPPSNDDVDSLFSLEMPEWLSRPEHGTDESASLQTAASSGKDGSLAPVDLPSWVQAMRPVEAVISEESPSVEDQPEEKEGPLAGMRGVIPGAPIGSSMRPKAISLKLQATDEQQASAALLEQILGSETSPRALVTSSFVASQQVLRWVVTALFLVVLGAVVSLRTQRIPISPNLPIEAGNITDVLMNVPAGSNVLVVVDYEPSLAGEMEAVSAPVLDQMVLLSHPNLSFLGMSPNGSLLVERLVTSSRINTPAPDGFGYQAGVQYCNLGYLPGGAAGVLGFIEAPGQIVPSACVGGKVGSYSNYAAVIVITDHAESGRVWVEQLHALRGTQIVPTLANQPLIVVASAQAAPLLQPYVSSGQVNGMLSGLSGAARYEYKNALPPTARTYWDAFGIGMTMAIALIIIGSLWNLFMGIRARRLEAE